MKYSPTFLFSLALLAIPLFAWTALANPALWQNRLIIPELTITPPPNTPIQTWGKELSGTLNETLTLSPADNPVILNHDFTIASSGRLTVSAGTKIYANKFTSLNVAGVLTIAGIAQNPVTITTNEQHEADRVWNGINIVGGGQANISYTKLEFASPAVTCQKNSTVNISSTRIKALSLGIYSESENCHIVDSRITSTGDGIISRGQKPKITDTVITASNDRTIYFD